MDTEINYWAVLVAAVASMVIGSIWYGPLFGKRFMKAMGMDKWTSEEQEKMKKTMILSYIGQFVGSCVMFFVLAWYIMISFPTGVYGGLTNAFVLWFGFVVPIKLADALWGGKMEMFWIGVGGMLVTLLTAGAIIGGWQ